MRTSSNRMIIRFPTRSDLWNLLHDITLISKRQSRHTSRDALRDHSVPLLSCWSAVLATWDIRSKIRGKVQYGKTCPCFEEKSNREEGFSVAFRYTESNT